MRAPVQQACVQQTQTYVCKENDTPRSIAKKMRIPVDEVLAHNRSVWPELHSSSRFKKNTQLRLPQAAPLAGGVGCHALGGGGSALCKHAVGLRENGGRAWGADDGEAQGEGGGDLRGVELAGSCKHAVGVCGNAGQAEGADDGEAGAAGGDLREVQLAESCKPTHASPSARPLALRGGRLGRKQGMPWWLTRRGKKQHKALLLASAARRASAPLPPQYRRDAVGRLVIEDGLVRMQRACEEHAERMLRAAATSAASFQPRRAGQRLARAAAAAAAAANAVPEEEGAQYGERANFQRQRYSAASDVQVGDAVLARYSDRRWYPARILQRIDDRYAGVC